MKSCWRALVLLALLTSGCASSESAENEFRSDKIGLVDTYVRSSVPDAKWGKEERLIVGGWGDIYDAFIKFDARNLPKLEAGDKVILLLFNSSSGAKEIPSDFTVAGLLDEFSEGMSYSQASKYKVGAARAVKPSAYGFWTEIDVTPEYQAMKNGHEVKGIVLSPSKDISANEFNNFHSSDSKEREHRPRLRIVRAPT